MILKIGHVNINDLNFDNILIDEKSYEKFLTYDVAYKAPCGAKSLCILFDKVDGYIRKNNRTKYLVLFYSDWKYEIILAKIRE